MGWRQQLPLPLLWLPLLPQPPQLTQPLPPPLQHEPPTSPPPNYCHRRSPSRRGGFLATDVWLVRSRDGVDLGVWQSACLLPSSAMEHGRKMAAARVLQHEATAQPGPQLALLVAEQWCPDPGNCCQNLCPPDEPNSMAACRGFQGPFM